MIKSKTLYYLTSIELKMHLVIGSQLRGPLSFGCILESNRLILDSAFSKYFPLKCYTQYIT